MSLDQLSDATSDHNVIVNQNFVAVEPASAFAYHATASAGMTWAYYAGVIDVAGEPTPIAAGTVTLTASDTNYISLSAAGVVSTTTSIPGSWPGPLAAGALALYEVDTDGDGPTTITDYRMRMNAPGATGATGPGVPSGGTAGQVLEKIDGTDYNTQWAAAGSASDAILGASGSSGAVIPGLVGSSDVVAGGTDDDEFDTTDASDPMTGWTTVGTPTTHDMNTSAFSHYYLKQSATAGYAIIGICKATPTMPFTVTMKIAGGRVAADYNQIGLFLGVAGGAGANTVFGMAYDASASWTSNRGIAVIKSTNPTTFSAVSHSASFLHGLGGLALPLYLRAVVTSSSSVAYQYSYDGKLFATLATGSNPGFTIGAVGIALRCAGAGSDCELYADWIRFI